MTANDKVNNPPGIQKFQDWALKSGFPFENTILISINKIMPDSKIARNMEFPTVNEEGNPTIRSIDFSVIISKEIKNIPHRDWSRGREEIAQVQFIIDCKYTTEESFLFTPSTKPVLRSERSWPHLVPTLIKDSFGMECALNRKDLIALAKVSEAYNFAGSGRKVKEQTKERDSVTSALLQVLQGSQHLIKTSSLTLGAVAKSDSAYSRNSYFFIPIIVTNAPLLLLRESVTVDAVIGSKEKNEVFLEVDSILVEMPDIYDLKNSWTQLKNVLGKSRHDSLEWHEKGLTDGAVLFCNQAGLERFLNEFHASFKNLPIEGR